MRKLLVLNIESNDVHEDQIRMKNDPILHHMKEVYQSEFPCTATFDRKEDYNNRTREAILRSSAYAYIKDEYPAYFKEKLSIVLQ